MKIEKIIVNKTAQLPDGIEIEVVVPENPMENGVLSFLLSGFLRNLKHEKQIPYELPDRFKVAHQTQGTFLVTGNDGNSAYYEAPKPLAIVGLRHVGGKFDLIHAGIPQRTGQQQQAAQQEAPTSASTDAAVTSTTAAEPPTPVAAETPQAAE